MEEIQSSFDNPQVQPLTTALKNICRDYPAGGAILRELLQNADDAGASVMRFVLDERTHATHVLINHELGQYQGPALLAYNNAKFSKADFKSLSRVGDSLKLEDGATTGKFGRGFNSVYNWTDSPCIVSEVNLLILDPHNAWSTGGRGYNFVSNAGKVAMKNQMAAYAALMEYPDQAFDGTIIRIPLRTKAQASQSLISDVETKASQVMEVLQEFAAEFKNGGLLFMRNIEKVSIESENGPIVTIDLKNCEDARRHKSLVNNDVKAALRNPEFCSDRSFELDIGYTAGEESTNTAFAVHHRIQGHSMDQDIRAWSIAQKYIPWVAIAVKLPVEETKDFQGSLFTVLPLPIPTNESVHIHGQFSLSPDRARLNQSRDKSSQDQVPGRWNEWLFNSPIPTAWVKVLTYIAHPYSRHSAFGKWPKAVNDPTSLLNGVVEKVISVIERDCLPLWHTQIGYVSASTGILGNGEESKTLMDALNVAKVPIVQVPRRLRPVMEHLFVDRTLNPQTLCMFLENLGSTQTRSWSVATKQTILEYLLSDPGFSAYGKVELFPFEDGMHRAIGNHVTFLHRDEFEAEFFHGQRQNNLDLDKLTASTRDALKCGILKSLLHPSIRYRSASDLKNYCLEVPFKNLNQDKDMVVLDQETAAFVTKVWSWIVARKVAVLDESIKSLWLLPLTNGQYRKIKPLFPCSDTIFAQSGVMGDLLRKFALSQDVQNKPLLRTGLISQSLDLVLEASRRDSSLLIKDGTNLKEFLQWLTQIDHIVEQASDDDKMAIVEVVASRMFSAPIASNKDIRSSIQNLPIFRKVSWKTGKGGMNPHWTWVRLNTSARSIGLRQGILPIPEIEGVQFLDAKLLYLSKVLQDLQLAKCQSTVEVLQEFIIPAWQGNQAATWDRSCKLQTVQLLFGHYSALDPIFRSRIKSLPIVPVICVNGQTSSNFRTAAELIDPSVGSLRGLFFEEEEVLPAGIFFKEFGHVLKECGLKTSVDDDLIYSRTRAYANSSHPVKVVHSRASRLAKLARWLAPTNGQGNSELQRLRWLPVTDLEDNLAICAADQCRSQKDRLLVGFELSILEMELSSDWNTCLGWDKLLPDTILIAQLRKGIEKEDRVVVDAVLKYFVQHARTKDLCEDLRKLRCVLDAKGRFVTASAAFRGGCDRLFPYLGDVDRKFWKDHTKILVGLGIREKPEPKDLLAVQGKLAALTCLEEADKEVAIATIMLSCSFPRSVLSGLKVLCESGRLYPIEDVNYNDQPWSNFNEKVNLIHPKIPRETANKLQIEPLSERLIKGTLELADIEDEDDFYQRERVTTGIADTLERYLPETTFKEYLANADDTEGSSEINWLLDKREHAKENLLTEQLKEFQGPALLVHNNGAFSDDDFEGFKDVGRGSKRDDRSKIGQFGRGSQTMFHWTDVPMLLSGKWLLILDPMQRNLPMNYRQLQLKPGVKIPLSKIRKCHPNQLAPFQGLWGYKQDLDEYPGTIFRFPLRKSGSILKENGEFFDSNDVQRYMTAFFDEARISLLFLRRVCSINFRIHGESRDRWSVSRQTPLDEEAKSFSELVLCRFTKDEDSRTLITGTDRWWVAIEDLDPVPSHLQYSQARVMKSVECGIAALISTTKTAKENLKETKTCGEAIQSKLFSTLPLMISSQMPVHIHATFSLSSDRRALVVSGETTEPYGSLWNSWLLDSALPTLYLAFLDDLGRKIGADVFRFWPDKVPPVGSPSELLYSSFWKMLAQSSKRLFPKAQQASSATQRRQPELFEISRAIFDFLPTESSKILAPLLQSLLPELVTQVPPAAAQRLRQLGVKSVTPDMLQTLFRSETAVLRLHEERLQNAMILDVLLSELISDKKNLDELNGCQILPLANGAWGRLIVGDPESLPTTYYVANRVEIELFDFASELLVSEETGKQFKIFVDKGKFNVTRFKLRHLGKLLKRKAFLSNIHGPESKLWLQRFWEFWNGSKDVNAQEHNFINKIGLDQYPIFEATCNGVTNFIEPSKLEDFPAVVEPCKKFHRTLCDLTPGLHQFNSSLMPSRLKKSEGSFLSIKSFQRFIKALSMLAGSKGLELSMFAGEHLITEETMAEFQELVQLHVNMMVAYSEKPEFILLKDLLRQLPLWPTGRVNSVPTFVSASEALVAGDLRLMVPWIPPSAKFIETEFWNQESNMACLRGLDICVIEAETLLKEYILPQLPPRLSVHDKSWYKPLISAIVEVCGPFDTRKTPTDLIKRLQVVKLAADQRGVLHLASDLFDHKEQIFVSAFVDKAQSTFLHELVRPHREFWLAIGLRRRSNTVGIDAGDYIKCINAISARLEVKIDPSGQRQALEDLKVVLKPLINMSSESGRFSRQNWLEIGKQKVFFSMGTSSQPEHRRMKMLAVAKKQPFSNLDGIISHDYIPVCWSQTPFAMHQATRQVLNNIPSKGKPSPSMVWKHVEFLMGIAKDVGKADIEGFLNDLYESYDYLQTDLSESKVSFTLKESKIWLNLNTVEKNRVSLGEMKSSWVKLENLLLSSSSDAPPHMSVRPGLMRYEKLLRELGCGSVVYPVENVPNVPVGSAHSMISQLQKMRKDGLMADITLRAGGMPVRAHRVVLAASSEYCAKAFSGNWSDNGEIELSELTHHALSTMIKAAYEEAIDWTEMEVCDEDGNDTADDKLELLLDLYKGADYWGMVGLAGQVESRVRRAFRRFARLDSVDNVMERASEVNATFLVSLCEKFCTENRKLLDARFQ